MRGAKKMNQIKIKRLLTLIIGICLVALLSLKVSAAKLTENVEIVGDIKKQEIWDGVLLERMHVKAKRVGSTSADPSIYDWDTIAISAENNPAIRIVTWGMDTQLNGKDFKAGTTLQIAQNYDATHPGYTVIAAVNGDFFANRGFTTSNGKVYSSASNEPLNTWIADRDAFKSVVMANPDHVVLGFSEDRSYQYHIGTIYGKDYEIIYNDNIYDGTGAVRGENVPTFTDTPIFNINDTKVEANAYLQTKQLKENAVNILWSGNYDNVDLSGYTVWKGYVDRFTVPQDGFNKTFIGRHPSDSSQNALSYTYDYTHYYLRGRLLEEVSLESISSVEENYFYVVTKNQDVISQFTRAVTVKVQYELTGNWAGVTSTMGVLFPFLINGERTAYVSVKGDEHNNNYLNDNKPKPAIGFKADGTCVFFFMGPGPLSGSSQGGPSSIEMTEVMESMGIVDAFCLDGGGSASIVYRNEFGQLKELNSPTDGTTRSVGNAILMVVEDSNLEMLEAYSTKATFGQSKPMADSTLVSARLHINGEVYDLTSDKIVVDGLTPNTTYEYYFEYTYEDDLMTRTTKTNVMSFKTAEEEVHEHEFVGGKCECGAIDPNYKVHTHIACEVCGKCVSAVCDGTENDICLGHDEQPEPDEPNPDDQEHVHEFVDGVCACGETDPDYEKSQQSSNGSTGCSMGVVYLIPFISALALIIIKRRNN